MRQAGILAAAGLIALEKTPARLPEDHANARFLAEGLARLPGVAVDPSAVATNIVVFTVASTGKTSAEISRKLKDHGVLLNGISPTAMRAVTHYDVSRADCQCALDVLAAVLVS